MSLRNFSVPKLSFSKRYFLLPIILIVFFLLFYLVYNDIKAKTINEFNNEQLIIAQAASQGIASFFQNYQDELTFLSQNKWIIDFNDDAKALMESFYNNHKNSIEAVTRMDAQGKILYTYPFKKSVIGENISYQKHVRQILTTHQPVISDVFMSVQGYLAVALHVPVFNGKEFKGSLGILIQIDKLGKMYFEKIKIRETFNTRLLSESGIEIFCQIKGHKGKSLLEITHNDPSVTQLLNKLKKEDKGTTKSIHPERGTDGQTEFVEKYIAFYRVPLGTTYWTIMISYNEDEIYAALNSFRNRLIVIFSFLFIVMAYYFYSFTKVRTALKEETKRKEAEKTLHESEEIFRRFMDHSPIYVFFKDEHIRSLRLSKNYETMLGRPVEELLGKNMFDLFPSDLAKKMVEDDIRILKQGKEIIVEEEFNGRFYSTIKFPIFINGISRYLAGYTIDITERKRAEEALRKSEEKYRLIVENSHDGIEITQDNVIIYSNIQFAEMLGYTLEELKDMKYRQIFSEQAISELYERDRRRSCGELGFSHQYETTFVKKDGTIIHVGVKYEIIEYNGKPATFATIQDITQRKLTEDALRESELKFRAVIEEAVEIVFTLDNQGYFTYVNPAGLKSSGYLLDELTKLKYIDLIEPDYKQRVNFNYYRQYLERKSLSTAEYPFRTKIGEIKWFNQNARLIIENGEIRGFYVIARDVTERRKAEEALRESENKLQIIIESTADGILAVDFNGKIIKTNSRFAELWRIPQAILDSGDDNELLNFVLDQLIDPEQFLSKVRKLYNSMDKDFDTLLFKDGRTFERYSAPLLLGDKVLGRVWSFLDVTERKRAEEALQKNEKRYRTLFELSPNGIVLLDSEGIIIDTNESFCKSVLYTMDELIGENIRLVVPEQNHSDVTEHIQKIQSGMVLEHVVKNLKKDGTLCDMELRESMVLLPDGRKGILTAANDITDRKRSEKALSESEEKFRNLVESINEVFYITDKEGRITYCSPNITLATGFTLKEILGNSFLRLIAPIDRRSVLDHYLNMAIKGETDVMHEFRVRGKDGKIIWAEQITHILRDASGSVIEYRNVTRNITDRKKVEEELKKVSRAVEQSPVSVIITNKEGDIEYVNEKFCEVTGYSREEVISKNPRILNSGYHEKDFYSDFWATILEGENWEGEMRNKKKNGELYWESVLVSPLLNSERSITHFVAIKEDITEKKMILEELIEAKEKAELSNKLKDAFIANMSHEIRTPLNGILGLSSIVKNLYAEHIKEEDESIFAGIDHSSKRIIRTVDMILNYSRIQTGEFPISPIEIELSLICKNLTKEFAIKAKSKLLEFSFENRCGKAITVFGDEYSITHSISNLLDNAIKYTEKGSIEIILYYGNKDEIMLDIKDSGIGISKEYLSHIFEPYQQEHLGYGRAYEGVGLGLSMVKKFLDLNKAEIFVTSEKGKGSTFTIKFGKALPTSAKKVTENKTDKLINGQATRNRPLILLVEDDVFNQAAIKIFIEKGYDTIITDSSEGALDIMKNNRVDLILMDISIKGSKNGLELTKDFKASKEYSHIPVIAITAHAFESDKHNALKAGCDDYLSKPFSKSLLLETISKFV